MVPLEDAILPPAARPGTLLRDILTPLAHPWPPAPPPTSDQRATRLRGALVDIAHGCDNLKFVRDIARVALANDRAALAAPTTTSITIDREDLRVLLASVKHDDGHGGLPCWLCERLPRLRAALARLDADLDT